VSDDQIITQAIKALRVGPFNNHIVRERPKAVPELYDKFAKFSKSEIHHLRKVELKDWRRQPDRGEWEPTKILRGNLAYVPNSTRHASLLARPRPHSYCEAIGPQKCDRNGNHNGSTPRCKKGMSKTTIDQNRTTKTHSLP
jgi:hypothetical protein